MQDALQGVKHRIASYGMPRLAASLMPQVPVIGELAKRWPVWGLPRGLGPEVFNEQCRRLFGGRVHLAHLHLSGWKPTGAFRLYVHTRRGALRTLIFKNEVYCQDAIPALRGLPIMPGPPEFAVYARGSDALSGFLPEPILCEELEPGRHYQYLLRDLMPDHRRARLEQDVEVIAERLAELHHVLSSAWKDGTEETGGAGEAGGLLRYRDGNAAAFLRYFEASIRRYAEATKDDSVTGLLGQWDRVAGLYGSDEHLDDRVRGPIHGDPNTSNVHLHRRDQRSVRFVDWEWCGVHVWHADLASLLKSSSPECEARGLRRYAEACSRLTMEEHERVYRWCKLERALLDTAFLATMKLEGSSEAKFNVGAEVSRAAARAMSAAATL